MFGKRHIIAFDDTNVTVCCGMCHNYFSITATAEKLTEWRSGKLIQNVFPELSKDERELLISGTCDSCFKELFSDINDENEE